MTTEPDLATLAADVQRMKDRLAIADCIARHARGCDRHDLDLIASAYWPDGIDEHGVVVNSGADYGAWANQAHGATTRTHTHNLTTHTCEIDGDTAHAESYVLVVLLGNDGQHGQCISGRYVDRLERRDGEWRIALRRSTVEIMFPVDASALRASFFTDQGYLTGARGHDDVSYQRPLTLEGGERW